MITTLGTERVVVQVLVFFILNKIPKKPPDVALFFRENGYIV